MARALRSSGAVTDPATAASAATANGTPRSRVLKRKRTDDEHHPSPRPTAPGDSDGPGDSASPLTDLAPSPAVKHEVLDDPPPPPSDKQPTRSPTPSPFRDGSDAPLTPADAHKLLTVLEMFDTQNLLARHVPSSELSLRAMLKTSAHSLRTVRVRLFEFVSGLVLM
ncbi:hypothetical protein FRC12_019247 [Ceratobasidium sp. 428]|nr:hypothetical protein FRC12_019247 [Ceratobasidium sp. 428]